MRLKRLEIYGFKSFAEKTQIVFNEGITGIVGPNGSGKSNIGDAVRWVLGEQNARILRGSKMEDVIFNGTARRKASAYCEVSLVFDNEDRVLRSEYSEVMVTRRVYRSGESDYYLNKTACRLKDVLELFRDTGIGRDGYSLIGQGRIDEILSARSDDRRQVFEEAAGVMTYRFRKEEAERKLARTEDNLSRVNDIISELEGRLEPLEAQAETARQYLVLSEQLKQLEIEIFILRYDRSKARIEEIKKNLDAICEVLRQREEEISGNTRERDRLTWQASELDERLNRLHGEQMETNGKTHERKADHQAILQRIEGMEARKAQTARDIADVEERIRGLNALTEADARNVRDQDRVVSELKAELEEARALLDAAVRTAEDKEAALDAHKTAILNAVNQLSNVKNQQARAQAVQSQMQQRLDELIQTRTELKQREEALEASHEQAKVRQAEVRGQLEDMNRAYEDRRKKADQALSAVRALSDQAHDAQVKLETEKGRYHLLSDMSRELEGYSQAVRNALKFGRKDPDVCDVLAKLIHVPQRYETAVDMVLGGTLQNIVTRDENAAKRIIDYLRNNRMGRATFLPMTTVHSRLLNRDEQRVLSMKGCIGVASELVSFDEEYRGVVENLLGRTIIAEDLESGIAIMRAGRHAFRLVTLAGDVMHSGGSMTGGTANKTSASLLGRERELDELKKRIAADEAALAGMKEELEKAYAHAEAERAGLDGMDEQIRQQEIADAREQEHVKNAGEELESHRQNILRTEEAIRQLESGLKDIEEDLVRVSQMTEESGFDQEKMERETEALQQELKESRNECERLRGLLLEKQEKCSQAVHQQDLYGRDRKMRVMERDQLLQRSAALSQDAQETEAALSALARQAEERLKEVEACEAALSALTEQVAAVEAERRSLNEAQRTNNQRGDDLRNVFVQETQKEHRLELSLNKAEGELNTLCEHMFNTYELTYAGAAELREQTDVPFDLPRGEKEAVRLRAEIREMGTVNVRAIEEYADTRERYDQLTTQRRDLLQAEEDLTQLIARLLRQMESQFTSEFEKLNAYFKVTFARLFGGGQAELKLTDPGDALNCDIEIIAQPPGKKLQMLSLLSGGERALTAIAILFAMLKLKPTPFCILDEIEAALDEANIGYFADYLSEYKKDTQFVVVTHRKGTMERCDALYGVAMQEHGVSGMVSVNLQDYE